MWVVGTVSCSSDVCEENVSPRFMPGRSSSSGLIVGGSIPCGPLLRRPIRQSFAVCRYCVPNLVDVLGGR